MISTRGKHNTELGGDHPSHDLGASRVTITSHGRNNPKDPGNTALQLVNRGGVPAESTGAVPGEFATEMFEYDGDGVGIRTMTPLGAHRRSDTTTHLV